MSATATATVTVATPPAGPLVKVESDLLTVEREVTQDGYNALLQMSAHVQGGAQQTLVDAESAGVTEALSFVPVLYRGAASAVVAGPLAQVETEINGVAVADLKNVFAGVVSFYKLKLGITA